MMSSIAARVLVQGTASGPVLVLEEPLSFWGGVDPSSGNIIDRRHPQHGRLVTGTVMVMPHGRGSSSSSYVLAELIRGRIGPAGIVTAEPDPIIVLGSLVAAELYPDRRCPVVVVSERYSDLQQATHVVIQPDGTIEAT